MSLKTTLQTALLFAGAALGAHAGENQNDTVPAPEPGITQTQD